MRRYLLIRTAIHLLQGASVAALGLVLLLSGLFAFFGSVADTSVPEQRAALACGVLSGILSIIASVAILTHNRLPGWVQYVGIGAVVGMDIVFVTAIGWPPWLLGCVVALLLSSMCVLALIVRFPEWPQGICRGCRYDLSGVEGPVCPECGRSV